MVWEMSMVLAPSEMITQLSGQRVASPPLPPSPPPDSSAKAFRRRWKVRWYVNFYPAGVGVVSLCDAAGASEM